MNLFTLFLVVLVLGACSKQPYSAPNCRVTSTQHEFNAVYPLDHDAACVTRVGNRLLVIQRDNGLFDLAYSDITSIETNLSGQCAAHQAMWQQTGFNVEVGERLTRHSMTKQLYACKLQAGYDGTETFIKAPPWKPHNVQKMVFIYPFDIDLHQWYQADEFIGVRDAYTSAKKSSLIHHINTSD